MNKKLSHKELGLIDSTFRGFTDQFGIDKYSKIMIEILFEELYGKSISLPGKSQQERFENFDNTDGGMPTYTID